MKVRFVSALACASGFGGQLRGKKWSTNILRPYIRRVHDAIIFIEPQKTGGFGSDASTQQSFQHLRRLISDLCRCSHYGRITKNQEYELLSTGCKPTRKNPMQSKNEKVCDLSQSDVGAPASCRFEVDCSIEHYLQFRKHLLSQCA